MQVRNTTKTIISSLNHAKYSHMELLYVNMDKTNSYNLFALERIYSTLFGQTMHALAFRRKHFNQGTVNQLMLLFLSYK